MENPNNTFSLIVYTYFITRVTDLIPFTFYLQSIRIIVGMERTKLRESTVRVRKGTVNGDIKKFTT